MTCEDFVGPVNIGNPGEFTMLELARKIITMTDSKSKLVFEPLPSDDPAQRQLVIDSVKARLGWSPALNLDEGLEKTI